MKQEIFYKSALRKFLKSVYKIEQKFLGGKGLGKITALRKIKSFLFLQIYPKLAEVDGLKLHLDSTMGFISPANYKKAVAKILKQEVKPGDTILDLGANTGYFTCLMAKIAGAEGKVFAFEPDPDNIAILKRNVAENSLKNITIVPMAVSDESGELKLFKNGVHSSVGFDPFPGAKNSDTIIIKVVRLDDFFKEEVSLIKMDIIGSEAKALAGMKKLLENNPNIKIVSAFCPAFLEESGSNPESYIKDIIGLGFKAYDITEGEMAPLNVGDIPAFAEKYSPKGRIAQGELFFSR